MRKIEKVLKQYDFIEFALLFGSFANNKNHNLSDVDIAIWANKNLDIFTLGKIIGQLEDSLEIKVDLVVLNNLPKINPKLAYNIMLNHKVIFCNNKSKYLDFEFDSLRFYLDVKPMYDMFNKAFEKRVENGTIGKVSKS